MKCERCGEFVDAELGELFICPKCGHENLYIFEEELSEEEKELLDETADWDDPDWYNPW